MPYIIENYPSFFSTIIIFRNSEKYSKFKYVLTKLAIDSIFLPALIDGVGFRLTYAVLGFIPTKVYPNPVESFLFVDGK